MDSHIHYEHLASSSLSAQSACTAYLLYFIRAYQGSEFFFTMCIGYTFRATPLNVI